MALNDIISEVKITDGTGDSPVEDCLCENLRSIPSTVKNERA
jgi:hypothetical protein